MVKFPSALCAERKLETTRLGTPKHLITKVKKKHGKSPNSFQAESFVSQAYLLTF